LNPIIYDDHKAKSCRDIITKVVSGELDAATSFLTWDEIVYALKKLLEADIAKKEGEKFINLPNLEFIKVDRAIILKAQDFIAKYSIDPRDAIHAATAIVRGANEIISDDSDFDKIKELARIKP